MKDVKVISFNAENDLDVTSYLQDLYKAGWKVVHFAQSQCHNSISDDTYIDKSMILEREVV